MRRGVQVEYIIMGGTFMSMPEEYRDGFIRSLHDALSGHSSSSVDEAVRCATFQGPAAPAAPAATSDTWQRTRRALASRARPFRMSEQSVIKCIGITIETRPDYCLKPHLRFVPHADRGDVGGGGIDSRRRRRGPYGCGHTPRGVMASQMLRYGCTRLEIGVQSVYEDVARDTNRSATPRT